MEWGTSLAWQVGQQDDIRRSSCERDAISTEIRWYLQGFTLGVHKTDYLVGRLHEELGIVPYYHDSLLTDGVQRASDTYAWQDNEWSRGSFMLDKMAWDPGIEGSIHIRVMQRSRIFSGTSQTLAPSCSDSGEHQLERMLVQALLANKQF